MSHRLRGEGGGASHQRGCISPAPKARFACFPTGEARLFGFTSPLTHQSTSPQKLFYSYWRPFFLKGAHHNPRAKGASNLSPLRTLGPKGRQPSRPQGRVHSNKKRAAVSCSSFCSYSSTGYTLTCLLSLPRRSKAILPSAVAKSVSSLPILTFRPGWRWVPL